MISESRGDRERGRDRVDREGDVGEHDRREAEEQRRGVALAVLLDEPVSAVGSRAVTGIELAHEPDHQVLVGVDVVADPAEDPVGEHQQRRAEDVDHEVELLDQRDAGEDEHAAHARAPRRSPRTAAAAGARTGRRSTRTAGGRRTGCRATASARSGRPSCRGPRPRCPRSSQHRDRGEQAEREPADRPETASLKLGSRPRAKKCRSSQRKTNSETTSPTSRIVSAELTARHHRVKACSGTWRWAPGAAGASCTSASRSTRRGSRRCCAPTTSIHTLLTADAYGAGEADPLRRPRAGRPARATTTSWSARSATTSTRASARARAASRASPTRACAAPTSYGDYVRMAVERSLERCGVDRFDVLLLHNPDRRGFESPAVWEALRAGARRGPDARARRRPRARPTASRST